MRDDGLFATVSYTDYDRDIPFSGDWNAYVSPLTSKAEEGLPSIALGKVMDMSRFYL